MTNDELNKLYEATEEDLRYGIGILPCYARLDRQPVADD